MSLYQLALVATLALTAAGGAWFLILPEAEQPPVDSVTTTAAEDPARGEPLRPLEPPGPLDPAKVALGKRLFLDPRLSGDGTVSCASCHDLQRAGVDGLARSRGIGGATGALNTPTVYDAWRNPVQFWDGRVDSLEAQIEGPLTSPTEMGSSFAAAIATLQADPSYARAFAASYPQGVTRAAFVDAVAVFERSLSTTGSRFDSFLRGDTGALTADEQAGYRAFKTYGCASCHQGANVGGNMFETLGVFRDYFVDRGGERPEDLGRYNVTGLAEDRHRFRVPSLRLAARTGPYFHDGSVATLEAAVQVMARYQLGREIGPREEQLIVQFLKTLAGPGAP
jgi:cytochrome c peroxidase